MPLDESAVFSKRALKDTITTSTAPQWPKKFYGAVHNNILSCREKIRKYRESAGGAVAG